MVVRFPTEQEESRMDALVDCSGVSDLVRAFLRALPRFRFETAAPLDGPARPFLLAEFREISLRSARVWL